VSKNNIYPKKFAHSANAPLRGAKNGNGTGKMCCIAVNGAKKRGTKKPLFE
jgi:hypothetical protein